MEKTVTRRDKNKGYKGYKVTTLFYKEKKGYKKGYKKVTRLQATKPTKAEQPARIKHHD